METEYKQFNLTSEEWNKFIETSELLDPETYNKLNNYYSSKIGQCSCVKTDVRTIWTYFTNL